MIKFSSSAVRSNNDIFMRSSVSEFSYAAVCFIPKDHPLYGKGFSDFDPYTVGLPSFKYDEEDVLTSDTRRNYSGDFSVIILLNNDSSFVWSPSYAKNVAQQFAVNLSKINNYNNSVQDIFSERVYSFGLL